MNLPNLAYIQKPSHNVEEGCFWLCNRYFVQSYVLLAVKEDVLEDKRKTRQTLNTGTNEIFMTLINFVRSDSVARDSGRLEDKYV